MNNIKFKKERDGKITTKTPFDLILISCPDTKTSQVKNNLGKVIYTKAIIGEITQAHVENVRDFMRLATTADLRQPLN